MSVTTTPTPPGTPVIADGELISTSPATGAEVGRFPVADADAVKAAVARARAASAWWRELGFDGRRKRLDKWRVAMAKRLPELLDLMHAEGGKPSPAVKKLHPCAAITDDRPITKPSDRSMPAEMMTKVWPSASRRGAVANTRIDWML